MGPKTGPWGIPVSILRKVDLTLLILTRCSQPFKYDSKQDSDSLVEINGNINKTGEGLGQNATIFFKKSCI